MLSKSELREKRADGEARRTAYRLAMKYVKSGADKDVDRWFFEERKKRENV